VNITRADAAPSYHPPLHHDVHAVRLQGHEAGFSSRFWVGRSRYLPGGRAEEAPAGAVGQVIAIGRANLELTAIGLALGGNARAGLEDTLYVRELAAGNLPLITRAAQLARDLDRKVAYVADAEALLCLPRR
jgi:hypothetical protein